MQLRHRIAHCQTDRQRQNPEMKPRAINTTYLTLIGRPRDMNEYSVSGTGRTKFFPDSQLESPGGDDRWSTHLNFSSGFGFYLEKCPGCQACHQFCFSMYSLAKWCPWHYGVTVWDKVSSENCVTSAKLPSQNWLKSRLFVHQNLNLDVLSLSQKCIAPSFKSHACLASCLAHIATIS